MDPVASARVFVMGRAVVKYNLKGWKTPSLGPLGNADPAGHSRQRHDVSLSHHPKGAARAAAAAAAANQPSKVAQARVTLMASGRGSEHVMPFSFLPGVRYTGDIGHGAFPMVPSHVVLPARGAWGLGRGRPDRQRVTSRPPSPLIPSSRGRGESDARVSGRKRDLGPRPPPRRPA